MASSNSAKRLSGLLVGSSIFIGPMTAEAGGPCDLQWSDFFAANGVSGSTSPEVSEFFVFDDGRGPALYVAGMFESAGGLNTPNIARFDGTSWSAVGDGLAGPVNALSAYNFGSGERLVAVGMYNLVPDNSVARWNGTQWEQALPNVPTAWMASMGVFQRELFLSGPFIIQDSPYFIRWTGSAWATTPPGLASVVWDQKVYDDGMGGGPQLYVAGVPFIQNVPNTMGMARWNGQTWSAVGLGINVGGRSMAAFDDGGGAALYVGGSFTSAGGQPANRVARWRNGQWSTLGAGFNKEVFALQVFDDGKGPALYAGGDFTMSGATPVNKLARWNGAAWEEVGGGITIGKVLGLGVFDDDGAGPIPPALYVGGDFQAAGGVASNRIARWGRCAMPMVCDGDANSSGAVNIDDLVAVIINWGMGAGSIGDLNHSGLVNIDDLVLVITHWGACP